MNDTVGATAITGAVLGMIGRYMLVNYLRRHHPQEWEALDRPNDLFGDTRSDWRFLKYIRTGSYKSLGDRRFTILCHAYRAFGLAWLLLFVCFLLLVLYVVLTGHGVIPHFLGERPD